MAEEFNIDKAVEFLLEGKTYRAIAEHFNIPLSSIHAKFSLPEHSARVREALSISADEYADKAEKVLIEAEWDENMGDFDLKKARELSQYYKWKAAKRNPRRYSDKLDIDHTTGGDKISNIPVIEWVKTKPDGDKT